MPRFVATVELKIEMEAKDRQEVEVRLYGYDGLRASCRMGYGHTVTQIEETPTVKKEKKKK